MRVALVGPTYPYRGGISDYNTLLCRALRRKHTVKFISFSRQYPNILFPGRSDREEGDTPLEPGDVSYMIDSLNPVTWHAAARAIARFEPDVLVVPWWVTFWAPHFTYLMGCARRQTGCDVTIVCHNAVEHEASAWKRWVSRVVLSFADRIVTHSRQETARTRALLGKSARIITGYHPTYAPLAGGRKNREQARQELGLGDRSVLLFFGFVRPYKGLGVLLRAMPRVLRAREVHLVVAGEFWRDKTSYQELIRDLDIGGAVLLRDRYVPKEQLPTYFGAADLVVQPYLSASGSGVCQLAWGFGRPVVATRVGSLTDVVVDGVNGRLVSPGDEGELASAIVEALRPSNLSRLERGAEQARRQYGWDRMADIIVGEVSPDDAGLKGKAAAAAHHAE